MTNRTVSVWFYNEVCGNEFSHPSQFFRTSASASVIQAIGDVPRMSNTITHVGKIYNVLSNIIANDVAKKVKADAEIHVRLLSQIGHTISDPLNANIDIITPNAADDARRPKWKDEAYSIAADWLDNIDKVSEKIIAGKIKTF